MAKRSAKNTDRGASAQKEEPRNRRPTKEAEALPKKSARLSESSEGDCPVWLFDRLDRSGKFAFNPDRPDFEHKEFLEKMIAYSNMTWGKIRSQTHDAGKSKHHHLTDNELSKDAVERIAALHLEEETDRIFSFALNNRLRIIGLREGRYFHVLWYDPEHGVCPSKRR